MATGDRGADARKSRGSRSLFRDDKKFRAQEPLQCDVGSLALRMALAQEDVARASDLRSMEAEMEEQHAEQDRKIEELMGLREAVQKLQE